MNINWFKLKRKLLNNIVWILLVLAVAVVGGLEPSFFKPTILGNVLSQATVLGILSFAQAFAIMLGLIDLSLLGVMSFSATCGLLLLEKGCPAVIAILVIFLTGVVSIFVNPMQFDRPEDLARYPRTFRTGVWPRSPRTAVFAAACASSF